MNIPTKFKEYIWLVNTIRKARRITFAEINEQWLETEMSGGVDLPRATFNRHKDAIQDIFGIVIDCDRQNGYKYYIYNERVLREDSVQNWMLSTLSVSNIISESLSLQNRLLLEPVSYESQYLPKVIEAMKRNVRIAIKYRKYGDDEPRDLNFEPYCLKMFRQRWYVLGHFHRDVKDGPDIKCKYYPQHGSPKKYASNITNRFVYMSQKGNRKKRMTHELRQHNCKFAK